MAVEQTPSTKKITSDNQVINQLREVTGASYEEAAHAYCASNYRTEDALLLLTKSDQEHTSLVKGAASQTVPVEQSTDGPGSAPQKAQGEVIDLTNDKDDKDEDLERAIALSLRDAQGITAEEQDISRVLEASIAENKSGLKRKRRSPWFAFVDPLNPHERKRSKGSPVGLKNVGNTCWFSAVIQSLFHLPVFRRLVLNFSPPTKDKENAKDNHRYKFLEELRLLFALLVGSKRKYVDPTKAVEILKEALKYSGSEANPGNQQDVSEFTHKLLEWLEETFKVEPVNSSNSASNPVVDLFFGKTKIEGLYEGKTFCNTAPFGAYPLQVQGYTNLHDSLEGSMAQEEIESSKRDVSQQSGQEHWFTSLPVVMTFMLSRFLFNQSLGKPEKIHKKFLFENIIYMDRYMEGNRDQTKIYREEVKKLKDKQFKLRTNLERYMCYGNGIKRSPINDILENTLRFTKSALPLDDCNGIGATAPLSTPQLSGDPSQMVSNSSHLPDSQNEHSDIQTTTLSPAPRHITPSEMRVLEDCLTRWKSEVEQDVQDINLSLEKVDKAINSMYNGESMKKVPYRLHAVLVHEGQASGGHYWAYIYDPINQQWRKYNDIMVTEVTWEEVQRESLGGYGHVSAYCIVYIDVTREKSLQVSEHGDDLPAELQQLVDEENAIFEKELCDWDKKQAERFPVQESATSKDFSVKYSHVQPHESLMEVAKRIDCDSALSQWCNAERLRLEKIARNIVPHTPGDVRLQHMAIYLIRCKAPTESVDRAILEQLLDDFASIDCSDSSVFKAKNNILKVIDSGRNSPTFIDSSKWKELYGTFQKANTCFLTGLEHFCNEKYQEALPYFVHSYNLNSKLVHAECPEQSMNGELLAFFRRQCFLKLNEVAFSMFLEKDHSQLCGGLDLVSELVIPCIPLLMASHFSDDKQAVDTMRNKWFALLGESNLDTCHQEKLQVFLPKLLDTAVGEPWGQEIKPPPVMRTNARDLCERFTKAMKWAQSSLSFPASS